MRTVASALLMLALGSPVSLSAQVQQALQPGQRVRVSARSLFVRNMSGTYDALEDDVLVVTGDSAMRIPLGAVTRLEVYRGQTSATASGLLLGTFLGAMAGGLIGGTIAGEGGGQSACAIGPCGDQWVAVLVALGGVVGAVSGGLIGESTRTDKWEEVPVDRLRVSLAPQHDCRFGIGLSVAF